MNPQYALLDGGPADGTRVPITDPADPFVVREAGVDHTYEPAVGPIADDDCHQYPSCDCETWPCEHPTERQASCWMTPWWNAGRDLTDTYLDDDGNPDRSEWHSGTVRGDWRGDGLTWQYAEQDTPA